MPTIRAYKGEELAFGEDEKKRRITSAFNIKSYIIERIFFFVLKIARVYHIIYGLQTTNTTPRIRGG